MDNVEAVGAVVKDMEAVVRAVEAKVEAVEAVEAVARDVLHVDVVEETNNLTSMKLHGGSVSVDGYTNVWGMDRHTDLAVDFVF